MKKGVYTYPIPNDIRKWKLSCDWSKLQVIQSTWTHPSTDHSALSLSLFLSLSLTHTHTLSLSLSLSIYIYIYSRGKQKFWKIISSANLPNEYHVTKLFYAAVNTLSD